MTLTAFSLSRIFLYGPSGAGKSAAGKQLAQALAMPFYDLDAEIEAQSGLSIQKIFASAGEEGFRQLESQHLASFINRAPGVIALGGGALLNEANRALAEKSGRVVCLTASTESLLNRLSPEAHLRPLLNGEEGLPARLAALLERREAHYASFPLQVNTSGLNLSQVVWAIQVRAGTFYIRGMGSGYPVRIYPGGLDHAGQMLREVGLNGPVALVSDSTVAPLYASRLALALETAGYEVKTIVLPAGEEFKTIDTVNLCWQQLIRAGIDRTSTVLALGGGVLSDLTGFAAATFLRGVRWAVCPTTLLSMADASLGGKTGADLPQGKNLIGAFYPPSLVLADPAVLATLPEVEQRSGMAEVLKHGILADPQLFELCAAGWQSLTSRTGWDELVRRAMAVKVHYIEADPFERGIRAALNLGHTVGHAVERASQYHLRHGEAVAIGLVVEAWLAEQAGLAEPGLAQHIRLALEALGLPTRIPAAFERAELERCMALDKKRAAGQVRFALPTRIGDVRTGVALDLSAYAWTEENV